MHTTAILELCNSSYGEETVKRWAGRQTSQQYIPFIKAGEITVAVLPDGDVVGFGSSSSSEGEVKGLFVSPQWTGKGIGSALVRCLEEKARVDGCETMRLNSSLNAEGFYEKMGYSVVDPSNKHVCCEQTLKCVLMKKVLS